MIFRKFDGNYRYREEAQQDIDSSSELVEELSRQTDELRRQQLEVPPRASVTESVCCTFCILYNKIFF